MYFASSSRRTRLGSVLIAIVLVALLAPLPAAAANPDHGKGAWHKQSGKPPATKNGKKAAIQPEEFSSFTLNHGQIDTVLDSAPVETKVGDIQPNASTISLPAPDGTFQDFSLVEAPIMEPGLAAKHPEITTYRGRGITDPSATLRADLTNLGFHASVRSASGSWYIDPYYNLDKSVYVSYYGRDLPRDPDGPFVERDSTANEISTDKAYYHAADEVTLSGGGFQPNSAIEITISDPQGSFADRSLNANSDDAGFFQVQFTADPNGNLDVHVVHATDGTGEAWASYQVTRDDDPTVDPPTGDVLRTYRLALITDPGYAAYHGGSANVTAAKVTLMNRVTQVYEDDLSIRMVLVANNDLLNFDTWDQATAPNGPCGAAACFTQSQVTGCSSTTRARFVIGQIIGASNYDIGHLALGQPGGGVANLGVVGRSNKAGGCTGIPTPTGDFYAIDYVAHEMGHQFSGNHPFNGNQLNCSGGNRNAATSVEPGSGSSIMAYAGICTADDLQAHSDPYFSQRSLQEISTYTSGNQASINEVQTASLVHFGGGNEQQVVTFGPGFQPSATIQPLSVAIGATPSATQLGGLDETGNTVTVSTGAAGSTHTLQVGDSITISGAGNAGYNGTFTVTAVLTSRAFQYNNPTSGLPRSGGGTVTLNAPGASWASGEATIRTSAAHNRSVGDIVTISGVGAAGYNGTFAITSVPSPRSFTYAVAGPLANSGGGTAVYSSPFQVQIGGNDSAVIGGTSQAYTAANVQAAINAIPGFAGTATVSALSATGFTVTYSGASAGVDVPNLQVVNLSCGGCFASTQETNHGGASDSFKLSYNGNVSATTITNGVNYTAAAIQAAINSILPAGGTVTVAGFGGGTFNNTGFQVTFTGALASTNVPFMLAFDSPTAGVTAWFGETDKGGAVDNKGGIITPTGNTWPSVSAPGTLSIPLRTPFALTGNATDAEGDAMLFSWEQNDRGGGAGTSLLNNNKVDGPLFAMFPKSGQISLADSLQYNSPGQNALTTSPTRVFPDLQQIIDNNTNAETGSCPTGPIAPPVPQNITECYAEFLPTSSYAGAAAAGNNSPVSLHFRFTARDMNGGVNAPAADTTLLLVSGTGPFLVTSPNTAVNYEGGSTQTVTWNVANTNTAALALNVKISLSTDGGYTYPTVLAASTPNDGSEAVTIPNIATGQARIKIEAVGNIFFDISNTNFSISGVPDVSNSLGEGGSASVQYSDALSPAVTVDASDGDTEGADLTANAVGLPAGLSLVSSSTSAAGVLPGTQSWTVSGNTTAAPGSYPVTVTVTDADSHSASTSFTIVVTQEDADAAYTGDMLVFSNSASANVVLRATIRDSAAIAGSGDSAPGDIRNATVTFKEGSTTLCGPTAASLLNPGDLTTGTFSCAKSLSAGDHTISVYVNNYYVAPVATGLVEVASPDGSFVTGGGFRTITGSAGSYSGDPDSRLGFVVNVKMKNGKAQQGHVNVSFQHDGNTYQAKSTTITSTGVAFKTSGGASCAGPASATCWGYAEVRAKVKLTNTSGGNSASLIPNATIEVSIVDKGEPGSSDLIAVTIWDGNTLVYSSQWSGSATVPGTLNGGNTVVH